MWRSEWLRCLPALDHLTNADFEAQRLPALSGGVEPRSIEPVEGTSVVHLDSLSRARLASRADHDLHIKANTAHVPRKPVSGSKARKAGSAPPPWPLNAATAHRLRSGGPIHSRRSPQRGTDPVRSRPVAGCL